MEEERSIEDILDGSEEPVQEVVEAPAAPEDAPPPSWAKEMHPHWQRTPKEVRDYWRTREQQMEEGVRPLKEEAAFAKRWRETVSPYGEMVRASGLDEFGAVRALMEAHRALVSAEPGARRELFKQLQKDYGLAEEDPNASYVDPALKALQGEFRALKTSLERQAEGQRQAVLAEINKQIEAFAKEHPLYNEVEEHIALLLQNPALTLEQAYEQAVWANPVTRAEELARMEAEKAEAAKDRARQAAQATGVNVRGTEPRTQARDEAPVGQKMDKTMEEALREIRSREAA